MHFLFFFFNDTATTEIYTLSLHDALPISAVRRRLGAQAALEARPQPDHGGCARRDRKSTRLNSSHVRISYAVFCLKKKKNNIFHDSVLSDIIATCIYDERRCIAITRRRRF